MHVVDPIQIVPRELLDFGQLLPMGEKTVTSPWLMIQRAGLERFVRIAKVIFWVPGQNFV